MSTPFINFSVGTLDDNENVVSDVIGAGATLQEALDKCDFDYSESNTFTVNDVSMKLGDTLPDDDGMVYIVVGEKTDNG